MSRLLTSLIALTFACGLLNGHNAEAAGKAPYKPGPGAPIFTQGDPAYNGISNAQTQVSANAPANAAAHLTGMVNQPPAIDWVTPTGTVVTAPASFALEVNASDPDGSVARVDYYHGTTLIGSATAAPFGFTWSNIAYGSYTLTAIATDNLGMSTPSGTITVIANQAPSANLTSPAANTVLTAPASFTLTADATDIDGTIQMVEFYANNGTANILIGSATAAPYTLNWNNVAYGSYSLTAVATDDRGAQTTSTPVAVISNAPPSVDLISPAANAVSTAPASFTLTANATDVDGAIQKVEFYNGATLLGTATAAPYSVIWSNVPVGTYSLTARATDNQGAQTVSTPVAVISNAPPSVDLTSPAANATQTAPASFTLTANATDSDGAIEKVEFYNGATLLGTATAAPYSVIWSNVPVGTYSLTARATDNHGAQTSSAPVDVTVKTGIAQAYYIHTDHLDTPRMITDTAGHVVWQWDNSDPFGGNVPNENPAGQGAFTFNLRFPGQYFDRETNLNYNINRDYDPATGRYVQSDPIGLMGGINTYGYVGGNPLRYTDPRGLNPITGATAGAEIGTAILPGFGTVVGAVIGAAGGYIIADQLGNLIFAKPGNESRPTDAPTGTKPIDQSGLGRGDVHDIKDGIGAGAKDWVGVTPDGRIVTSTPGGKAVDHGPADDYTQRPTGLCGR